MRRQEVAYQSQGVVRRQEVCAPGAGRGHAVKEARSLRTGRGAQSCGQEGAVMVNKAAYLEARNLCI